MISRRSPSAIAVIFVDDFELQGALHGVRGIVHVEPENLEVTGTHLLALLEMGEDA